MVVGLARLALAAGLVIVILGAVAQLLGSKAGLPWWSPIPVSAVGDLVPRLATATAIYLDPFQTPDVLFLLAAVVLLGVLALRFLLAGPLAVGEAPIDRIGRDPRRIGRFLGAWLAMTGVMLALMPAFFLGGMALLHYTLKAYYP